MLGRPCRRIGDACLRFLRSCRTPIAARRDRICAAMELAAAQARRRTVRRPRTRRSSRCGGQTPSRGLGGRKKHCAHRHAHAPSRLSRIHASSSSLPKGPDRISCEISRNDSRNKLEIRAADKRWIIEFKYAAAEKDCSAKLDEAKTQIVRKRYGQGPDTAVRIRLAIVFNAEQRQFTHWAVVP